MTRKPDYRTETVSYSFSGGDESHYVPTERGTIVGVVSDWSGPYLRIVVGARGQAVSVPISAIETALENLSQYTNASERRRMNV